ncbi:MAG: hypothetical protein LBP20_00380 [Treponema sp.]|jgi:hypothetical protein|nr:hypothetical protein [Treponema sp.]
MKRGVLTGLVLCLIPAILLSGLFIASHTDHDCRGEECPLCALLQGALNFSRQLRQAPVFPALFPGAFLPGLFVPGFRARSAVPASAVRLKVRINR